MMPPDPVIVTRGLSKHFGRRAAVSDLHLAVNRGEIFGFLGPNGAGKSTTIRMLLGLIAPSDGDALICGHGVRSQRTKALRHVGAIVERPCFYEHLTARKNLQLAQRLHGPPDEDRIDEVLRLARLADRGEDAVETFSHGMKQRLGIARAILHRPRVVILDEPSDGLDPRGRLEMREIILELTKSGEISVLLSSHLLNEMETLCHRVGILHQGRLVYQGDVAGLRAGSPLSLRMVVDRPAIAASLLRGEGGIASVEDDGGGSLRVIFGAGEGEGASAALVRRLVEAGLQVSEIVPVVESLEDVFLRLTEEAPC